MADSMSLAETVGLFFVAFAGLFVFWAGARNNSTLVKHQAERIVMIVLGAGTFLVSLALLMGFP